MTMRLSLKTLLKVCVVMQLMTLFLFGTTVGMKQYTAKKIENNSIKLDGILNEDFWQTSATSGEFLQKEPNDGSKSMYRTVFSIAYDDQYLYAGIRAYDNEPEKIIGVLTRRDENSPSDWLYLSLDSYNDNQTAFEFGLNAAGVKQDLRRFDDDSDDSDWDAVWDGEVNIDDEGWTAEFRIPFRELRFTASENMEWGLLVSRQVPRDGNEWSVWSHWSLEESGFVSHYGSLLGLKNINSRNPIYITPYIVGQANFSENLQAEIHDDKYNFLGNTGADIRYSFSNGLTLNGTVNPDFGQVEADPAEFNLTEFESYFGEKRPYFVEGSNIFNFQIGFNGSANSLIYSRRIGRTPQLGRYYSWNNMNEVPEMTTILASAKLSGKTENGFSIGILNAVTDEEIAIEHVTADSSSNHVIEPLTNYFVGRIQKDFRDGQTNLGAMITSTNRKLNDTDLETFLRENAYTGGIDFRHEFAERKYGLYGNLAFSHVNGDSMAILRTQMSSGRNFQRPDADHVEIDPSLTSLSGGAFKVMIAKLRGVWRWDFGVNSESPGFEINDLGFLGQVDNINQFSSLSYRNNTPKKYIRNYQMEINQNLSWNYDGLLYAKRLNINSFIGFLNNWNTYAGGNIFMQGYNFTHLRGGPSILTPQSYNMWWGFNSDNRKNINFGLFTYKYYGPSDNVKSLQINPRISYRPAKNIQFEASPRFTYFEDSWAWVTSFSMNDKTRYIFSDLIQKTASLTLRTDLTLSNNLSIQFYAQPFITAGTYTTPRDVENPKSSEFDERFVEFSEEQLLVNSDGLRMLDYDLDGEIDHSFMMPDFNYKSMNTNLVVRWELKSGSTLYLVWSSNKKHFVPQGNFDLGNDVSSLWNASGDNVLLLKFNYLLNI